MKKPLIGIVTKYYRDESFYNWTNQEISNDLRYALCKNGARVVGILPQCSLHYFQELDEHDTCVTELFCMEECILHIMRSLLQIIVLKRASQF